MVDENKLAKAGNALKGQAQQDEPKTPADLAITSAADAKASPPRQDALTKAGARPA